MSIADYSKVNVNLIVTGNQSADTLTVDIEHSFGPAMPDTWWTTIPQLQLQYTTGAATILTSVHDMLTGPGLGPYIRVKASLQGPATAGKAFIVRAALRE